ncbi:hypothetical protein P7C73_g199, partial [Tremellales sp. Uapishka_1]
MAKPGELEAGALNAWTPLQQAALYAQHAARQAEKDDKEAERAERKKKEEKEKPKPETVTAGQVVEDLVEDAMVPKVLAPISDDVPPPGVLHPRLHPVHQRPCALVRSFPLSLPTKENPQRPNRQAYWVEVAALEYVELMLFGNRYRALALWPWVWLSSHSTWRFRLRRTTAQDDLLRPAVQCRGAGEGKEEQQQSQRDRHGGLRECTSTLKTRDMTDNGLCQGAIKLIKPFLPDPPKKEKTDEEKKREKERAKEKAKEQEKEKEKGKAK